MHKIKDRILLGSLCGMIAGIPGRELTSLAFEHGLTEERYNPLAAGLFLPKRSIHTPEASLLGLLVNNMNIAAIGVLTTYLLSATGRDRALLKGMGVGALSWVIVDGLLGTQILGMKPKKAKTPLIALVAHLSLGALCAELVRRLGDDSLFPPQASRRRRIPLIHTGQRTSVVDK